MLYKPSAWVLGLFSSIVVFLWWKNFGDTRLIHTDLFNLWSGGCVARNLAGFGCVDLEPAFNKEVGLCILAKYPPWSIPVLYAMASLPFQSLSEVWLYVNIISITGAAFFSTFFWFDNSSSSLRLYVLFVIQVVLFCFYYPIDNLFHTGQTAGLQLLAFEISSLLVWKFNKSMMHFLGGVMLGFVAVKPQVIPLYLGIIAIASLYNSRDRSVIYGLVSYLVVFSIWGFVLVPNLNSYFLNNTMTEYFSLAQPNIGSLLFHFVNRNLVFVPLVCSFVLLFCVRNSLLSDFDFKKVLFCIIPLGLFVGPYTNVYDLVFMLPGLTCAFADLAYKRTRIKLFLFLFAVIFAVGLAYVSATHTPYAMDLVYYPVFGLVLGYAAYVQGGSKISRI